jgi:hypothetical protein
MTTTQKIRFNELMRIAKGDEYMSMAEFDELLGLFKLVTK